MTFQTIMFQVRPDRIGIITLNRPKKLNAISTLMRQELITVLAEWNQSDAIGAVIIIGAGTIFSGGFDLDELKQTVDLETLFNSSARFHRDLWQFPKPVIAAVNGAAIAGGFDLAVLCDMRICSYEATFGHPEIKIGLPPLFTPLHWIVGAGLARDLCLTGRHVDSYESQRIGLVSKVVAGEALLDQAIKCASGILEAPRTTLQFIKKCFIENSCNGFEESFQLEHDRAFREIILKANFSKGR